MKFKLDRQTYTTLFTVASSITTPSESKVTAAGLIEKIRKEVGNESPEEIVLELEICALANLCLGFVELVKEDNTKPGDILVLKALARSIRVGNKFESLIAELEQKENTIELDPVIDIELDAE